jgi:pimeloyl-ACP methyl ester carboxylesterase
MRRTGGFRGRTDRDRYVEVYDAAMRQGPLPDKELDVDTVFGTTRVYRYGDGPRPIVLLPGMANSAATLARIAGDLGRHHPVYTVDTIGEAGMSVQTAPLRDHADRARWLDEVLAELDLTGVHLAGFSSGGFYAAHQAIHAPDRLASVTLIEPTTVTTRFAGKIVLSGLVAAVLDRDSLWRRFMRVATGMDVLDRPDVQVVLAGIRHFRPAIPPQVRVPAKALASITLPVLAVFGARSPVHDAVKGAERLRELLPHAEVELWPRLWHYPTETDHARLIETILART